jgi:hypothetical protein
MRESEGSRMPRSKEASPVCVISGDIHFTPATLELATSVVQQMKAKAKQLGVPMILNGDTLDSKAIVRGECANRLIELLDDKSVKTIVNVGNHDLISEKGKEHVLNFLKPYCRVVDTPTFVADVDSWVIPYFGNNSELQAVLNSIPNESRLIVHQGVETANLGHYVFDKSSLPKESYANFRTIGSHYHCRQDIKCGRPRKGAVGLFSYVGSGYTVNFGEANDPEKGFQILMDDGSLEFVPTNLRKHVVAEAEISINGAWLWPNGSYKIGPHDLIWLKITGPRSELKKLNKEQIGKQLLGHSNYKLDLLPTDAEETTQQVDKLQDTEVLDNLIDSLGETKEQKLRLKSMWREIV